MFDNIFDYLLPIGILILYFLLLPRKHKESSKGILKHPAEEERKQLPVPHPHVGSKKISQSSNLPPVSRRQETFRSQIEDRNIESTLEESRFISSLAEVSSLEPISKEMLKHIDMDPAYALKTRKSISQAKRLMTTQTSIRQAFFLKQILDRPYD